jgi:NAD(P)-dependent dehydrogenase (short-subunit alcohol dehydrogenase family)
MEKSILISGASSGIGRALCLELDRRGYHVFAGVRSLADADQLRSQASPRLSGVIMDITIPGTITAACDQVSRSTGGELFCLVNNAGVSIGGPLEFLPLQQLRQQLEVNLVGQLALSQACIPLIRKSPSGRLIFVSSVGGRIAMPFNGPYSISKAGLVSMADTLRLELKPWDIPVSLLIVASVRTPIWEKAAHTAGSILRDLTPEARSLYIDRQKSAGSYYRSIGQTGMPVERVVKATLRNLESRKPREYTYVGIYAILAELMVRLLPVRFRDWFVMRQMNLH